MTTITESFNTGDSATLGPDLSWTELGTGNLNIVSNKAQTAGAGSPIARANSDLASTDHYSQAVISSDAVLTNTTSAGMMCRKDSSATLTFYVGMATFGAGSNGWIIFKCVAGSFTSLATGASAGPVAASTGTLRLEANGSSIALKYDAVTKASVTDTAVTAGVRCGMRGGINDMNDVSNFDNFEAGDLAAGATAATKTMHYRKLRV